MKILIKCLLPVLCLGLTRCKEPEVVQVPVFSTDQTDDQVFNNTIITYNTYQGQLYAYNRYTPAANSGFDPAAWKAEAERGASHQKIYDLFCALIPAASRSDITYFSIIDSESEFAAMASQKKYSLQYFNLSVRASLLAYLDSIPAFKAPKYTNTLGYPIAVFSLIHEYGHYVCNNASQSFLQYDQDAKTYDLQPKAGSFADQIITNSWRKYLNDETLACFEEKKKFYFCFPANEFVSGYASTNYNEDAAESFAHFVLLDHKPDVSTGANRKILLFYQDASLVTLRTAIRANLARLGIVPRSPNMTLP